MLKDAGVDNVEPLPSWADSDLQDGDSMDDPWEDERSWRDPSVHKLRGSIAKWIKGSEFLSADLRKVCSSPLYFESRFLNDILCSH